MVVVERTGSGTRPAWVSLSQCSIVPLSQLSLPQMEDGNNLNLCLSGLLLGQESVWLMTLRKGYTPDSIFPSGDLF